MDEADPPGRVEIGHTADAHSSGWERPRGNAIGNDESSSGVFPAGLSERSIPSSTEQAGLAGAPSHLPFPRRRVLAAGAAIVVLGLLVGWVIGRADREPAASDGERQQTVTTQVATTISLVEGSLPGEVDAIAISSSTSAGTVPTTMGASGSTALTRQSLTVEGIPFSFVSLPGWERYGDLLISKSTQRSQKAEALIFWAGFPDGTDADPCVSLPIWEVDPASWNTAEIAATLGSLPGTELLSGPSSEEVGGYIAHHVVFTVHDDAVGCDPGFLYNWKAEPGGAFWMETELGDTIRVWVVDVDGVVLLIAGETHLGAGSIADEEIEQIVSSIQLG